MNAQREMKKRGILTALVGLIAVFASGAVSAATFQVNCGRGPTIQDRLDRNASGGDTIEVSGTCVENVVINIPGLSLVAQPGAQIIAADPNSPVIVVQAPRVRVDGFTMSGGFIGIQVRNAGSAVVTGNVIEKNRREGINIVGSSTAQITGNTIQMNGFEATRGHGIFVGQSSNANIAGNVIDGNGDVGVRVADASAARLSDNDITNNRSSGIDVTLNSSVRLSDPSTGTISNRISGNGTGVPSVRGFGWLCRINSSIWPFQNQDFGAGNAPANTSIESGCVKQGAFF